MTDNGGYQELVTEVHNVGALVAALGEAIGAAAIRLPESMKGAIGTETNLWHPFPTYAPNGVRFISHIGPDSIWLRLATGDGMTLHEWRNQIQWVPDIEWPGTEAWNRAHR